MKDEIIIYSENLLKEITDLIESAKSYVACKVKETLVFLYWQIGKSINQKILDEKRAEYGKEIIIALAHQLRARYGRGFNRSSLFRITQFAKAFPEEGIVATVSRQLSWSHFVELLTFDDPLKQQFYTEMCRLENWSVRDLRDKVDGQLYERTMISKQPEEVIKHELAELKDKNRLSKNLVFRDPYILDFLNLPANYSENNLESAILKELCQFLQELGTDFCFIARQKRITIDKED